MTKPGEWFLSDEPVEINAGRRICKLKVRNTGDRPIQVGSHYHFFEVNRALSFDRAQAMGMHLNLPGGLATRFEPGDEREIELVEFGGTKQVVGFNDLMNGGITAERTVREALRRARNLGFIGPDASERDATGASRSENGSEQNTQEAGHGTEKPSRGNEANRKRGGES